ncbi:MAG: 50S ribosomal protein L13 [Oscillospiraceae bacterium]|jgi:large subunit ribosomal protein L13|nr:50S ribosomal protein L13 [Oscillospiraceae bacterium]
MGTYMANPETVERQWYLLDAAGVPLGRTAAEAAVLLRGKHKPEFTPHVDSGDFVVVINADKAVLTGRKAEQKYYRRHSGFEGGLKETKYRILMEKRPELAMELAVKGMIPRTTPGRKAMTRLKVYKGAEHPHGSQKPVARSIGGNA